MVNHTTIDIAAGYFSEDDFKKRSIDNLMEAIVDRAVRDALGTAQTERDVLRTARQWIHSNSTKKWSLLWIAQELPLSSTFIARIRNLIPIFSSRPLVLEHSGFLKLPLSEDSILEIERTTIASDITLQPVPPPRRWRRRHP